MGLALNKLRFELFLLCLQFVFLSSSFAHPVSYQGANSIMTWNSEQSTDWMLTHSFTSKSALSYHYMRMKETENANAHEEKFHLLSGNFLLKRWNELESQANIYLSIGGGNEVKKKNVGYLAVDLDWESRDYYVAYETQAILRNNNENDIIRSKARIGFAPYRGNFEELNSWVIAEVTKDSDSIKEYDLTPFVRFYYRNVLTEFGMSMNGEYKFNFMVHF